MSYFDSASDFQKFGDTINYLVKRIRDSKLKPQAVAARGTSGALVLMSVASKLKIPAIFIRKQTDNAHTDQHSRTSLSGAKNYIIIDDFVSTGKTVDAIMEGVEECAGLESSDCLGVFEYEKHYNGEKTRKTSPNDNDFTIYGRTK